MDTLVDVLIPTYNRPAALAVTLTSLIAQTETRFRVVISDQSDDNIAGEGVVRAVTAVLQTHGHEVVIAKHLPRRGMAEQRQFLLDQVVSPYALFLDDDLILENNVIQNMVTAIQEEDCGFVGCAVIGLSFLNDVRPNQQAIEFWESGVQPEKVRPHLPAWERYQLHNAANLFHVQQNLGLSRGSKPRRYKVAWVGGCVMYDAAMLRSVGGFAFWKDLPDEHSGEDVVAQLRVMDVYGGCGLIPSGVYHQELPTTITNRRVDAPKSLDIGESEDVTIEYR